MCFQKVCKDMKVYIHIHTLKYIQKYVYKQVYFCTVFLELFMAYTSGRNIILIDLHIKVLADTTKMSNKKFTTDTNVCPIQELFSVGKVGLVYL